MTSAPFQEKERGEERERLVGENGTAHGMSPLCFFIYLLAITAVRRLSCSKIILDRKNRLSSNLVFLRYPVATRGMMLKGDLEERPGPVLAVFVCFLFLVFGFSFVWFFVVCF